MADMKLEEARQRIETAIEPYGWPTDKAIKLMINEARSEQGAEAVEGLSDEFDLELQYSIVPLGSDDSNI